MAQVTITKLRLVEAIEHFIGIAGTDLNAGDVVRFDGTTGKVVKAAADTAFTTVKLGSPCRCGRPCWPMTTRAAAA